MRRLGIAGFGVLWLVFAACSGESEEKSEGGDDGVPSDWASACSRSADIICDKFAGCSSLFLEAVLPPDCATFYAASCRDLAGLPGVTLTPATLLACYEAFGRMSCDDIFYNSANPPECEIHGTLGPGSPCSNGTQCQSSVCSGNSTGCGVCEVLATEGQSCLDVQCISDLDCNATFVCVSQKDLGDACSTDDPCPPLMNCTGGVCSKPPGAGEPCTIDDRACDFLSGATCNSTTLVCEPLDVPGVGEACEGICQGGSYCNDDTTPATCVAQPGEGDACNAESGPDCAVPFVCTNGTCVRFDPTSCG